ncbi:MAG: MotA/TolQ/ExbB proton channel family protein, partial [Planctomycetaceae bacterium]
MSFLVYLSLLLGQAADGNVDPVKPASTEAVVPAVDDAQADNTAADSANTDSEDADPDMQETDQESETLLEMLSDMLNSGALGLLRKGGWFMAPILVMGVIAAGVIIERFRSLKMLTADSGTVREKVLLLLREDRIEEALELCEREQGPVPAILSAGLRKFLVMRRLGYDAAKTEEQVVKAMDDYGVHIVAALEKHLPVLATVSSAAPMLGFLGTVAGMITSFEEIVAKMGETNIVEAAAGGISVALLTTAFGLIIGIPAFMAFNYFSSIINRFVL